jgi:membrane protease YdiL (CAAX protease family)
MVVLEPAVAPEPGPLEMHLAPPIVHTWLTLLMLATGLTMPFAWIWAIWLRGPRPLVPQGTFPTPRWGTGTMLAAMFTYFALYMVIGGAVLGAAPAGRRAGDPTRTVAPKVQRPAPDTVVKDAAKTDSPRASFTVMMLAVTLANGAAVLALPLVICSLARVRPAEFGLSTEQFGANVRAGVISFLLVTPWVYLIFGLSQLAYRGNRHPLEEMLRQELSPLGVLLAFISAVVLAPLAEEMLFRGILQTWLTRLAGRGQAARPSWGDVDTAGPRALAPAGAEESSLTPVESHLLERSFDDANPYETPALVTTAGQDPPKAQPARVAWTSIVLTSLVFAVMHWHEMPAPIALFLLSLALGYLYQRTGNLVASVTLHALFNAFSTLQLLVVVL